MVVDTRVHSGKLALLHAIEEFVDEATYRGDCCSNCVIGQVSSVLGNNLRRTTFISDHFDIDGQIVRLIFATAAHKKYRNNLPLFMEEYVRPLLLEAV